MHSPFSTDCVLSFGEATRLITEGDTVTITTQVSNPSNSPISVRVLGTGPLMITIPTGVTSFTFEFPAIEDNTCEDDETVTLTLDTSSLPEGCTVGNPASTTVTIEDDDSKLVSSYFLKLLCSLTSNLYLIASLLHNDMINICAVLIQAGCTTYVYVYHLFKITICICELHWTTVLSAGISWYFTKLKLKVTTYVGLIGLIKNLCFSEFFIAAL